jgi:hypothetical protein
MADTGWVPTGVAVVVLVVIVVVVVIVASLGSGLSGPLDHQTGA